MRLFGTLDLAALSFVAALGLAELAVRIAAPAGSEPQPRFAMDADAGWVWAPNQHGAWQRNDAAPGLFKTRFSTNGLGLRGREYPPDKGGDLRILALGDSYTEGWGVEAPQAWPQLLESGELSGAQVWNLGVPGYSTDQEYQLLRRFVGTAHPDLVLLQFDPNDAAANMRSTSLRYPGLEKPRFDLRRGGLVLVNGQQLWRQRETDLLAAQLDRHHLYDVLGHSALFRWARFRRRRLASRPALLRAATLRTREWLDDNPYRIGSGGEAGAGVRDAWRMTGALLAAMQRLCAERRIPFVVVYVPPGFEAVPGFLQAEIDDAKTGDSTGAFDLSLPARTLDSIGRAEHFPVVDLRDAFRTAPDPAGLYLPIVEDGHLTPRGQALVAHGVAAALRGDGLLPADRMKGS